MNVILEDLNKSDESSDEESSDGDGDWSAISAMTPDSTQYFNEARSVVFSSPSFKKTPCQLYRYGMSWL